MKKPILKSPEQVLAEVAKVAPKMIAHIRPDRNWLWYCGPDLPSPGRIILLNAAKREGVCADTGETIPEGSPCLYEPFTRVKNGKNIKAKVYSMKSPTARRIALPIMLMVIGFIHAPNGHATEDGDSGSWGHHCMHPTKFRHTKGTSGKPAVEEETEETVLNFNFG